MQMKWLPNMDLNHDKQIQRLLCYRYTIPQGEVHNRWGWMTVKIGLRSLRVISPLPARRASRSAYQRSAGSPGSAAAGGLSDRS